MATRPREAYTKNHNGKIYVGTVYTDGMVEHRQGPQAEIYCDETWLYIITDKYEGHVMLDKLTIPHLRSALSKIARKIAKDNK